MADGALPCEWCWSRCSTWLSPWPVAQRNLRLSSVSGSKHAQFYRFSSVFQREHAVEVAESVDRLRVEAGNKVTQIDACPLSRPVGRDVHDQETILLVGTGTGAPLLWEGNFLHCEAKVGPCDMAPLQEFFEHTIDGFGGQCDD